MHSPLRRGITCSAAFLAAAACSTNQVPHVAPDESRPHITWELRTGGQYGNADLVCGSAQPSRGCLLPSGTGQRQTMTTVYVYVHAAARQTNYLGVVRAPFIASGSARTGEISTSVPPGSRPVATTVTGLVTSTPGAYTLGISLDAIETGMQNPTRISQEVPVSVIARRTGVS